RGAAPAPDRPVDQIGVALGEPRHALTELFDPAGVLVAEDVAGLQLRRRAGLVEAVVDGHVGVAGTRSGDLQEHLPRTWYRPVAVDEDGRRPELLEDHCAHDSSWVSRRLPRR